MTEKQKFVEYLKKNGYKSLDDTGPLFWGIRVPHYYKTPENDHILTNTTNVCIWEGSDCKIGDLGCVTFYIGGSRRKYRCRYIDESAEILKHVFIPRTSKQAIFELNEWYKRTSAALRDCKMVM